MMGFFLPLLKVLVRGLRQFRKKVGNDPYFVFYDSTSSHRLLVAFHSVKIVKIAIFRKCTQQKMNKNKFLINIYKNA